MPDVLDVPTLSEAGLSGFEVSSWMGLRVPAGTPPTLIKQLDVDVRRALESPDTRQQLLDAGLEPTYLLAARLASLVASEVGRFSKIVADAGIVAEQ